MSRSVLLDTETTGLEPGFGHRVLEVAALELINDLPTGTEFHHIIDPCRDIPEEATRIHGFTSVHVRGKPRFAEIAEQFVAFLADCPLVAHNAPFDFAFLDAEFALLQLPPLHPARMIDTLALAKARFPGLPNSLDALCRRFAIDLSARTTHNALLDCRLLADVYVELTGGRQRGLSLELDVQESAAAIAYQSAGPRTPRLVVATDEEEAAHAAFIARLKDPVWLAA
ncbi:MAG: DNA polymerase III subunit epsilon [Acetobacteraceae bacterium]|nr:DNA polymerase III subunit epsilon [Acetobacteraceae bacterium]